MPYINTFTEVVLLLLVELLLLFPDEFVEPLEWLAHQPARSGSTATSSRRVSVTEPRLEAVKVRLVLEPAAMLTNPDPDVDSEGW